MSFTIKFTCPNCGEEVYHLLDEGEAPITVVSCTCGSRFRLVPNEDADRRYIVGFSVMPLSPEAMRVSRAYELVEIL